MEKETEPLFAPTSYGRIKTYSQNLKDYIAKNGRPFGLSEFPYEIKMDFDTDAGKGLGRFHTELGSKRVLCVLGLGENAQGVLELKVSFLGLDDKDDVDPRHKPVAGEKNPPVDGEETWPPDDIITNPTTALP